MSPLFPFCYQELFFSPKRGRQNCYNQPQTFHKNPVVLDLSGTELTFFTAAHMVLWFGFVVKKVLITHQRFGCCWTVFSPCPMWEGSERAAVWVFGCWPVSAHHESHEDKISMESNKDLCRVMLYASVPVSLYGMVCMMRGFKGRDESVDKNAQRD